MKAPEKFGVLSMDCWRLPYVRYIVGKEGWEVGFWHPYVELQDCLSEESAFRRK